MSKTTLVFAATLALMSMAFATTRITTNLDSDWRFKLGDQAGAQRVAFEQTSWERVQLPHNWGWEDAQRGMPYYRGPGWYRRPLDIGAPKPGRRYFLRFGAASSAADLYVNGTLAGKHRGAFGAFCFEITKLLTADGHNLLAVRVSNAPEHDIAPLSGDFNIFGGLYRSVDLIETDEVCFNLTDHASPGVAWYQKEVTEDHARLDMISWISNGSSRNDAVELWGIVLDASGREVVSKHELIPVTPGVTAPYPMSVDVFKPHLWNGREDPYLYNARVEIRSRSGELLDAVDQPLGLRYYRVDPEKGFFLNGKPYHLHGVNRHQDRQDKGWAITDSDMRQDIGLIKDLGCTAVRCAHYQHGEYFYSLCDTAGILVWAELPQVDEINPSPEFEETSRDQLLDLIRQNVNHPSIFVWSLFNELWPGRPDPHRELVDLNIVAHGEDPTRPTIAATATEQLTRMNKIPDLLGWNMYPGWYSSWGSRGSFGAILDRGRTMSRSGGFCVSEYGAGANITQHEENPHQPQTDGQWHPEEWQSLVHEAAWNAMKQRPFVWGTFVWNMFDFAVSTRHEGGVPGRNDKGLVTYDRSVKKDAYFFYRANWSDQPTLYITSRRFVDRTVATTDVKVYSNANSVELFVNDVSLGSKTSEGDCIFRWGHITLREGENQVVVKAKLGGTDLSDHCVWNLRSSGKNN